MVCDTHLLIFLKNENWSNRVWQFWTDHGALEKWLISSKNACYAIVRLYFQSSSEWFVCFTAYDTKYPHFYWLSNWRSCRWLFWSNQVTSVKFLNFTRAIFTTIVQICFQNSSEWFTYFTVYDTSYLPATFVL